MWLSNFIPPHLQLPIGPLPHVDMQDAHHLSSGHVHLVAKIGNELKIKFIHTPHTTDFTSCHLLFLVFGTHHVHTLPNTEVHL